MQPNQENFTDSINKSQRKGTRLHEMGTAAHGVAMNALWRNALAAPEFNRVIDS